ncbi:hypothetical protein BGW38_006654 [Lunasporangiospora selenospora]|uniref:Phosphatidic acid phosphatase type 2/haloperoxidase domain-containing protein n=1 Tax=Lunasporangiospora selenospora TaxID=979761 RepID=A0A9P6KAK6_9FUNG|nr:hypothetical protein BGW38_006654 [Lunasporangiospora selenospora]
MSLLNYKQFRNPVVRLVCSYLFDWVLCFFLIGLFFLLDRVEPFHREFSVQNIDIMFPFKEETVPLWALGLICTVFPILVIALVALGARRSPYDLHNGLLGLLVSVLLTTIFTQVIKVTVGKHRPDFLSRCQPAENGIPITHDLPLKLWPISVCAQTDKDILKDGMRSFPSGHASTSFAGLFYLSLWLAGKMHVFDRRGYSFKGVIIIAPILAAMLVAISRVEDYRHSAFDVTWGSIIGIVFAIFAYHQYYPSLLNLRSHVPHPPRDFSYLVTDSHGNTNEATQLENVTGIRPNHDLVDETRSEQQPRTLNSFDTNNGYSKSEDPLQRV